MAISTTAAVLLLSSTGLGVWVGWKIINKKTRDELQEEADKFSKTPTSETGKMRKFILGSRSFGFCYAYAESSVHFVHTRPDGTESRCSFPVDALRTPAAAALIAAFFAAAQVPMPSAKQMDHYVHEVQATISIVATSNNQQKEA